MRLLRFAVHSQLQWLYFFASSSIAGVVAQLAERLNRIQEVVSSILIHSTEITRRL